MPSVYVVAVVTIVFLLIALAWIWVPYWRRKPEPQHSQRPEPVKAFDTWPKFDRARLGVYYEPGREPQLQFSDPEDVAVKGDRLPATWAEYQAKLDADAEEADTA